MFLKLFDEDIMGIIDEKEGFQSEIILLFDLIKGIYEESVVIPAEEEACYTKERTKTLWENLKSDISEGFINLGQMGRSPNNAEWGGAGVIITTDPERPHADHHIFIVAEFAPVLTWVMERLRDICSPDYIEIALEAKNIWMKQ